jgi:hypothetical protein
MTAMLTLLFRRMGLAVAILVPVVSPALSQDFGEHSMKQSGPPVENHPKVDERAYKAALEKIPPPAEKYDPWGAARPSDQARPKAK